MAVEVAMDMYSSRLRGLGSLVRSGSRKIMGSGSGGHVSEERGRRGSEGRVLRARAVGFGGSRGGSVAVKEVGVSAAKRGMTWPKRERGGPV